MAARSVRSGAGKACSVVLAVTLGTMGVTPQALADTTGGGDKPIQAHVGRSYLPKAAEDVFVSGNLEYQVIESDSGSNEVAVYDVVNKAADLVIPQTVFYNGDAYTVTRIDAPTSSLASSTVTIPASVTTISEGALSADNGCKFYFLGDFPSIDSTEEFPSFDSVFTNDYTPESVYRLASADWDGFSPDEVSDICTTADTFTAPTTMAMNQTAFSLDGQDNQNNTKYVRAGFGMHYDWSADDYAENAYDVPAQGDIVSWTSSAPSVATVTVDPKYGHGATVSAVGNGTAVITAVNAIGATATCTVTVTGFTAETSSFESGDLRYQIAEDADYGKTAKVIGMATGASNKQNVVVPATVDKDGVSYDVTEVAKDSNLSATGDIIIGSNVKYVFENAFSKGSVFFLGGCPWDEHTDPQSSFADKNATVSVLIDSRSAWAGGMMTWAEWLTDERVVSFALPAKLTLTADGGEVLGSGHSVEAGKTLKLGYTQAASVADESSLIANAPALYRGVTWQSSNDAVATVAADGTVTVKGDASQGQEAVITATDGLGNTATCKVIVAPATAEQQTFTVDGVTYQVNAANTSVSVAAIAAGAPADVIIPANVKNDGRTYVVNKVAANANLVATGSITFPATITAVEGANAFGAGSFYFLGAEPSFGSSSYSNAFSSRAKVYYLKKNAGSNYEGWGFEWYGPTPTTFKAPESIYVSYTAGGRLTQGKVSANAGTSVSLTAHNAIGDGRAAALDAHQSITWSCDAEGVVLAPKAGKNGEVEISVAAGVATGTHVTLTAQNSIGTTAQIDLEVGGAEVAGTKWSIDPADDSLGVIWPYGVKVDDMQLPMSNNSEPVFDIESDSSATGFTQKLTRDVDYRYVYKNAQGTEVAFSDIATAGTYTLEVQGMGDFEGTRSFTFNVAPASSKTEDGWLYFEQNGEVSIVGYDGGYWGTDRSTELRIPAEINGKPVTGIAAGALTGEVGVIHIPASVKTLASKALSNLDCQYVLFEGACPAGDEGVVSGSPVPGIYYAQGATGWDACTWFNTDNLHSYNAAWEYDYDYTPGMYWGESGTVEWGIAGCKNPVGDLEVPASVFLNEPIKKIKADAIADASQVTSIVIPASIETIEAGAVSKLPDTATVSFLGDAPDGDSYGNEFLDANGDAAKGTFTYLPDNAASWQASMWVEETCPYNVIEKDLYVCNVADFSYLKLEDGTYAVLGYDGSDAFVRIPTRLSGEQVDVYKLVYDADYDAYDAVLDETDSATGAVTEVGDSAFLLDEVVEHVAIPEGITRLGDKAFSRSALQDIKFEGQSTVTELGESCFWVTPMTEISLPASVETIEDGALLTGDLESVQVDEGSTHFKSDDGILLTADGSKLVCYPQYHAGTSYVVPDTVKVIGERAFMKQPYTYSNLESVTLPSGLEKVEDFAFMNSEVTSLTFPATTTELGVCAFQSMYYLTSVDMSACANLEKIPDSAFFRCETLTDVKLPAQGSLKAIDADAFAWCIILERIDLPEGLKKIGDSAFLSCAKLKGIGSADAVSFPDSLEVIDDHAFSVTGVTELDFSSTNIQVIGLGAFADCADLTKVTMPGSTIETFGGSVFSSCGKLSQVIFPKDCALTEIPDGTFNATGLETVIIPSYISYIGSHAFFGCMSLGNVFFLNQGQWDMSPDAFNVNGGYDESGNILLELPNADVVAYGYNSSSTKSIFDALQLIEYRPLDVTLAKEWEGNQTVRVGTLVDMVGHAVDNPPVAFTYSWSLDGAPQEGADTFVFSFTPTEEKLYRVTLTVTLDVDPDNPVSFDAIVNATNSAIVPDPDPTPTPTPDPSPSPSPGASVIDIAKACTIDAIADQTFTGKEITPDVVVRAGGKALVPGTDYTVTYVNNVLAGEAVAIVSGKGAYGGFAIARFNIVVPGETASGFKDVPANAWYRTPITRAAELGLMRGYADPVTGEPTGYFGPEDTLTRGQVAVVFARMAGADLKENAANATPFVDVANGAYYTDAINWAYKNGVMRGVDTRHANPTSPITRQELIQMAYNLAKAQGKNVSASNAAFLQKVDWRDVPEWASEAMIWATDKGVLNGVELDDGARAIAPADLSTRAQMASFAVSLTENIL